MEFKNRMYSFAAFLVMILFSQVSNAIIITNYTAFYEDGSQLVVDLKGYDYGVGSYNASSIPWNESSFPPVEGFDTILYPSIQLQKLLGDSRVPWKIGSLIGSGLWFEVDDYFGVSMTSFLYVFQLPDWGFGNNGLSVQYFDYYTKFTGGFFRTYTSPYQVSEPGIMALMLIGMAGLGWARRRRKA
jgi:hypothetical protein